jgi:hypothetical protein
MLEEQRLRGAQDTNLQCYNEQATFENGKNRFLPTS